jgi:DNA invertase Pin-like site-specific DNA recombinase
VERVNAGLSRAKREGKTLGRPRLIVDRDKVTRLASEGLSVRAIAGKLHLTRARFTTYCPPKSHQKKSGWRDSPPGLDLREKKSGRHAYAGRCESRLAP